MDSTEFSAKEIIDFSTAPIGKLLFVYSLSSILSMLAMAAYETTDRVIVGHFAESGGIASVCGAAALFDFSLVMVATIVAYNYGMGNHSRIKKTILYALSVATGFFTVVYILIQLFARQTASTDLCHDGILRLA